jgi:hypothetical protein
MPNFILAQICSVLSEMTHDDELTGYPHYALFFLLRFAQRKF